MRSDLANFCVLLFGLMSGIFADAIEMQCQHALDAYL